MTAPSAERVTVRERACVCLLLFIFVAWKLNERIYFLFYLRGSWCGGAKEFCGSGPRDECERRRRRGHWLVCLDGAHITDISPPFVALSYNTLMMIIPHGPSWDFQKQNEKNPDSSRRSVIDFFKNRASENWSTHAAALLILARFVRRPLCARRLS